MPESVEQGVKPLEDGPSFHDLLVATIPSLRMQAIALTKHRADAEDLVQAAVTNALAAKNSFEPGTNFKAWMVRILRNRFFSNFRRRREMVELDNAPSFLMGRSGGQEEHIALQELRRNLARLAPDSRAILLMISVEGLSYDDAAERLGVAVGTLKCRVFRARKQLQEWMLGEGEPVPAKVSYSKASMKRRAQCRLAASTTHRDEDVHASH